MNLTMPLDPDQLDCRESTLALALHGLGHTELRTLLGAQWWFEVRPGAVEPVWDFTAPVDRITHLTGLESAVRPLGSGALEALAADAWRASGVAIVVSDAYVMPWLPYAGNKHVEHSFVVDRIDDGLRFRDGYANRTEWGDALPVEGLLTAETTTAVCHAPGAQLLTLVPPASGTAQPIGPAHRAAQFQQNAVRLTAWMGPEHYVSYADSCCSAPIDPARFEFFCEVTWSIERRRRLNAQWLEQIADDGIVGLRPDIRSRVQETVVQRWADVNRFTYLAMRRMRSGRSPSGQLVDLVGYAAAAEADVANELAALAAPVEVTL